MEYGNFLKRSEQKEAGYEYNKPLILLMAQCVFVLLAAMFIVAASVLVHLHVTRPVKNYDSSAYETALSQTNSLAKSIAMHKEARPNGIDVCYVVDTFIREHDKDIDFKKISITPKKYVLTAWTKNMGAANDFTKNLAFDEGKTAQISTVKVVEDTTEFLVTVTDKGNPGPKGVR